MIIAVRNLPLIGQHREVNCKDCHKSLEFAKAQTECNSCHTDIHEQTVGNECARCHTPNSWIVTGITQLHQLSRFPLVGPHTTAECKDCHTNLLPSAASKGTASLLRFDPLGIECFDCHRNNYLTAANPNHVQGNFSTNCTECHTMNSFTWSGAGVNHDFFPLSGGHEINNCSKCHTSGNFSGLSTECVSCHQPDYQGTSNPNHSSLSFSTNCKECHTTNPGWKPAEYRDHDGKSFPIYTGKHKGEWNSCSDCHTNTANYSEFTCINCHEHSNKSDVDKEHEGVSGYTYSSTSCFACHPTGSGEGSFDHSKSSFPLTGAHTTTNCTDCHTSGYAGTPNVCSSCHINNYNQTINPNHKATGSKFSEDCAACHTTVQGWKPATYPTHSNLEGAHVPIANDCATCHQGNYANSPNTCFVCHTENFNQTTNPNHVTSQFLTTCETCHSQNAWTPATFDHTAVYPLTGAHINISANCALCHAGGYTNTPNTCAGCHQANYNQSTNPNHNNLNLSGDCASCHTTNPNWEPASFPTHNNYYVIAGAHTVISNQCAVCHNGNYITTPNTCNGCHINNYNQTTNPNHAAAQFPVTCSDCHTQSAWTPSTFNHDGQYFPIYSGKHKDEWSTCADCHTNPSNFSVYTCTTSCHPQSSTNNQHQGVSGYSYSSNACFSCHPNGSGDNKMNDTFIRSN